MTSAQNNRIETQRLTGLGVMTAMIVILQLLGSSVRFGPFSISLVNVPLAIGAILYGTAGGVWLGFVFGLTVLLSGDAAAFLAVSIPGTVLTVLGKGMAAGGVSALVYRLFSGDRERLGAVAAAFCCPVVNTGVFLLGCFLFFMDTLAGWAEAAEMGGNVVRYMLVVLVGMNFLAELAVSAVLTPVILRLLSIIRTGRFRGK